MNAPSALAVRAGLDELALGCRVLAMMGQNDLTSGHLSWRDPAGRGLWLKRSGVGLDEILGPDDFVLIDLEGRQLEGRGRRHLEWPIHAEIVRRRPDVHVVGHTHAYHAQLFSTLTVPLLPIAKEAAWLDDPPKFRLTCNLIRTPELGRALAEALGEGEAVFMQSHGMAFCGPSVRAAVLIGICLEKAAQAQLDLAASGLPCELPTAIDVAEKRRTTRTPSVLDDWWDYLVRHLDARPPVAPSGVR